MASDAGILELVETGLYQDAARALDARENLTNAMKVARARLEMDVGNTLRAREAALLLLKQQLTNSEKSSCWEIIGRADLARGQTESGLTAIHRAFTAASHSHDTKLEARLIANHCDSLLNWIGIESAVTEIQRLRQAAVATGDPYCLVAFHSVVAQLKAKRGLVSSAKRSVETARGLLERWPNVWQQGRLANSAAAIHVLAADYESASTAIVESLECAYRSGSRRLLVPALGNLAHIRLAQGALLEAREAIGRFLSLVQKGGPTEITGLDTQLQIALAEGNLNLASEQARIVETKSAQLEGGGSYHGLWWILAKVKLLYRSGELQAGLSVALEAIPRVERMADRNLLERLKLLAAEGFARTGRLSEGSSFLTDALGANEDTALEIFTDAIRVTGLLTAPNQRADAVRHFEQAAGLFQATGNITALNEVIRDAKESIGQVPHVHTSRGISPTIISASSPESVGNRATGAGAITERIAAFVELAALPLMLARECLTLIVDTGAAQQASIACTDANGTVEVLEVSPAMGSQLEQTMAMVRIPAGSHRNRYYEILAVPKADPSARATLFSIERIVRTILAFADARRGEREQAAFWPEQTKEQQLGLICASERMLDLVKTIRRVAGSNVTVLLTGETGVGKELFARAVHLASQRKEKTFLPFNCTTVPREMLDSQLFGHRRGSFTGANEDSPGLIKSAAGGTLFLDEIGDMNLEAQPKLLRFLESGEILPLGKHKTESVDVRIVAATNTNLEQLVHEGKFREDLYYRLNVIRIEIPPLRERREEIPLLVNHFLELHSRELQKPAPRIADETLEYLVLYRWPGNVRQLGNEIRRLVAMAEPGSVLMPAHLSTDIAASRRTIPAHQPPPQATEVVTRIDQPLAAALEHVERAAIQRAIALCDGGVDEAAKLLGLSRKGLYLKRQRLGLE